jgi:transcription initiation factor TFIIF subunit beta
MLLSDLHRHQQLPKEYQLDVVSEVVRNTFVFTEQDLPGYKTRPKIKPDPLSANMPPRLNQSRVDKPGERQAWDKNKRSQPYYRRTVVPSKIALCGAAHEMLLIIKQKRPD